MSGEAQSFHSLPSSSPRGTKSGLASMAAGSENSGPLSVTTMAKSFLSARLGALRVADEAQREAVLVEDEREDVLPVPLLSLEPVHLGFAVAERGVGDPVRDQVLVGAPDAAPGVGLRDGARLPRPAGAGEGEVAPDGVELLQVHVVVHGALADVEEARVVRHDVPHGLPLARAPREHLVDPRELLVGGVHAPARLVEQPLVVGLGSAGDVELLRQRAAPLPLAAVADERRRRQPVAGARAQASTQQTQFLQSFLIPQSTGHTLVRRQES